MHKHYKNITNICTYSNKYQRGASALETALALPLAVILLLLAIQLALIFRVKLTLQYAAHEAARIGALNNGAPVALPIDLARVFGDSVKNITFKERKKNPVSQTISNVLGSLNNSSVWDGMVAGMMPLFGTKTPDQSKLLTYYGRAYQDLLRSTCIEYLNPTQQSFLDWGFIEFSGEDRNLYQIPTDTLRYRKPLAYDAADFLNQRDGTPTPDSLLKGATSNKTLADANVLHLRVNYGYTLNIPIINEVLLKGYKTFVGFQRTLNGFENAMINEGKLPMKAEGAVGMQTPLHWHPFYSFGPKTSMVVEKPDPGFDDLISGNDYANFAVANLGTKAVTQFIGDYISNASSTLGNQLLGYSKELGNGIAFCPATWLNQANL